MTVSDISGWIGTILIVSAYLLLSFDIIEEDEPLYVSLNLVGAIGVGINVFSQGAWPALALQVVWGGIALISLIKHGLRANR